MGSAEEKESLGIEHKEEEKEEDPEDNKMEEDTNTNTDGNTNSNSVPDVGNVGDEAKEKTTKPTSDEKSEEAYVPPPADPSSNTTTAPTVSKPIEQWQIEILREAAVETICKMVNLMRPDVKKEKLGKDLSKLITMCYDKEFRNDVIQTLSRQIYQFNIDRLEKEGWKELVSKAIKQRDLKNRFVDTLQLQRRPGLCRISGRP